MYLEAEHLYQLHLKYETLLITTPSHSFLFHSFSSISVVRYLAYLFAGSPDCIQAGSINTQISALKIRERGGNRSC